MSVTPSRSEHQKNKPHSKFGVYYSVVRLFFSAFIISLPASCVPFDDSAFTEQSILLRSSSGSSQRCANFISAKLFWEEKQLTLNQLRQRVQKEALPQ
jgi:hypothetical protein